MASDVFHTIDGTIYFPNVQSIDNSKQTIYSIDKTTFIYNVVIWRQFKAQYDTWKLEQKKMNKHTFRIRNNEYDLSDVIAFNENDFTVTLESVYEQLTQEQFGDFLIAYGNWIKQRKIYEDGWYKAKNQSGNYRVFRLINNLIKYPGSDRIIAIDRHGNGWTDIESIDPLSNEFVEIFKETVK